MMIRLYDTYIKKARSIIASDRGGDITVVYWGRSMRFVFNSMLLGDSLLSIGVIGCVGPV